MSISDHFDKAIDLTDLARQKLVGVYPFIRSLELDRCAVSQEVLDDLLLRCSNLERFAYLVGGRRYLDTLRGKAEYKRIASTAQVITVLRRRCQKLNALQLAINSWWNFDGREVADGHVHENQTVPSISGWTSLEEFDIFRFDLTHTLKGDYREFVGDGENGAKD